MGELFGVWGRRAVVHSTPETWGTRCDGCRNFECIPQEKARINPWKYRCNKLGVNFGYKELFKVGIDECPERKHANRKERW